MRLGRPTVSLSAGTGHGDFEDLDSEQLGTCRSWPGNARRNQYLVVLRPGDRGSQGWGHDGEKPGFPTLFWGLSGFFVDDLMGKALWRLVENAQRFPRCGGRVLCVHGAGSFHRAHPYATRSPRPRTAVDT